MKPIYAFASGVFVSASIALVVTPNAKMYVDLPYWPFAVVFALGFAVIWVRAKEGAR